MIFEEADARNRAEEAHWCPQAVLTVTLQPPLTVALVAVAVVMLPDPPLTEDCWPLAVLFCPPLTEEKSPLAALWVPPLTEE